MQIFLEIGSGSNAGTKIPLNSGAPLRLGRNPKADHAFPDDKLMSSLHFAIDYSEKGCRLIDLQSSNGTFLNGARVKEATLANGDEIRAGSTVFVIRILGDQPLSAPPTTPEQSPELRPEPRPEPTPQQRPVSPSASPSPLAPSPLRPGELPSFPARAPKFELPPAAPQQQTPNPPPPAPRQPRLQDLLAKDFQPLYALLDASREPSVLKVILESKEEYQSLFEGAQGAQLAHFAPYLIRIPQKSPLIETLTHQAWSKSWGVFLTCDQPLKDLRTHFRHFLTVNLPDGSQVYFRYYDPRVLRLFLPTCLPEETTQFFGPVKHFLIEAEDPATALHFTRGTKGADKKELQLALS
jgi:pSer/pThr/pTyr-binding forkhead associated (FHA) protein